MTEFKFEQPSEPCREPAHGDIAIVYLPVRVLFTHSDKIVADRDEEGNILEYRSGLVMRIMEEKEIPYVNDKVEAILGNTKLIDQ